MEHKIKNLKLSKISSDQRFNINSLSGYDSLKESIDCIDIVYPLLIWEHNSENILIDGFKRLEIAKNFGRNELPFISISSDTTLFDVIRIRYYDLKQNHEELNILQKISIYSMIEQIDVSMNLLNDWKRQLNLSQPEHAKQILNWPSVAKNYIHRYNVSYKQIRFLLNQDVDVIREIFLLADFLSIRIVELSGMFEMALEIALNDNTTILHIFKSECIQSILYDENYNRNQKIFHIKMVLYQWRFPKMFNYQKELERHLNRLSFKTNTKINYDKYFEKPGITFSIYLKNIQDLENLIDGFSQKSNVEEIKNILELL